MAARGERPDLRGDLFVVDRVGDAVAREHGGNSRANSHER
jgi:hypothetical protein